MTTSEFHVGFNEIISSLNGNRDYNIIHTSPDAAKKTLISLNVEGAENLDGTEVICPGALLLSRIEKLIKNERLIHANVTFGSPLIVGKKGKEIKERIEDGLIEMEAKDLNNNIQKILSVKDIQYLGKNSNYELPKIKKTDYYSNTIKIDHSGLFNFCKSIDLKESDYLEKYGETISPILLSYMLPVPLLSLQKHFVKMPGRTYPVYYSQSISVDPMQRLLFKKEIPLNISIEKQSGNEKRRISVINIEAIDIYTNKPYFYGQAKVMEIFK